MKNLISFLSSILILVGLPSLSWGQNHSTFTCENFEFFIGDPANPWIPDEQISKVELKSTLTPLWDVEIWDGQGQSLGTGSISGVAYYFDLSELSEEMVEIAATILNVPASKLVSYQLYPIEKDGGDGTGFSILEFYKRSADGKAIEIAGSVFFRGWGFGRCSN